jgi:hypothetical protein
MYAAALAPTIPPPMTATLKLRMAGPRATGMVDDGRTGHLSLTALAGALPWPAVHRSMIADPSSPVHVRRARNLRRASGDLVQHPSVQLALLMLLVLWVIWSLTTSA